MSKVCTITGKKPVKGNQYTIRGIAKYLGGIGLKTTSKTRTRFNPNLHNRRIVDPETGEFVSLRLSNAALRTIDKKGIRATLQKVTKNKNPKMGLVKAVKTAKRLYKK
jgi:large subunit ribosomal protein L28